MVKATSMVNGQGDVEQTDGQTDGQIQIIVWFSKEQQHIPFHFCFDKKILDSYFCQDNTFIW